MPKAEKTLSVFVDESGTFRYPDPSSRYYIVALVFHDQSPVTNLLHTTFSATLGKRVEFAQNVRPQNYKLFQVADLVCTTSLIERRLLNGERMTESEYTFFGGPRLFKRNILKYLKRKEI